MHARDSTRSSLPNIPRSFVSFRFLWKCEHADRKYGFLVVSGNLAALPFEASTCLECPYFSFTYCRCFRHRHRLKLLRLREKCTVVERRGERVAIARSRGTIEGKRYPHGSWNSLETRNMKFADRSGTGDDKYKAGVVKISRTKKSERQGVKAADGGGTKRVNSKFRTFRRILDCNGTP